MTRTPVIEVHQRDLDDLRHRLRHTRWSPAWPSHGWSAGTDVAELQRLCSYWADGFDWYAQQRTINELPWRTSTISGSPIRYLRFDAEVSGALPLILTNGWPSTALELVECARRLAEPTQYGGEAADAFTVIIPALPGFPFSPQRPGHDEQNHELWHTLMHEELGFERYAAHGGDLGAGITSRLAQSHPEALVGIHLLAVAAPADLDSRTLTTAEQEFVEAEQEWEADEGAYQHQQQTRPLTLAPGLADSPTGLLAWILEKYRSWSDCDGDLSSRFTDDFLLTQASLYWFTNTIASSFRPYWEFATGWTERVDSVSAPTAVAVFPHDLAQPPRSWAERTYNVVRYSTMPRGGHFAPHEEPELLTADIRDFLRPLR
ncbi:MULTISPECIES: epoxide hydrolase family protein [Brevibacterium]|uniref:Hydrolase n=2 Tax=Brevibacterium TaxID=1696 RepID=A0A2A3Z3G6_BREAU|nr:MULTISPECIES: epoxide hydrolase family protein [Brevibacterium]MDN5588129.1 epoxide hydrolase [Brevibacterium sp.]PCC45915.1 hydrolase [Brevibacterium aurantiacum]SMX74322.1 Pimeloyl-ACP methyl ester carboxylesterase [Brevibacterium antiquum CNRZ 918]HCG54856.1 epoxide hydrolase [Brevibacterium sp.]